MLRPASPYCTVHVPGAFQPLFGPVASTPNMYTFFAPANPDLKVIGSFNVSAFPLAVTLLPASATEHCPFCNVEVVPGAPEDQVTPASSNR